MIKETIILSTFFGTVAGMIYDSVNSTTYTNKVYEKLYMGASYTIKDAWSGMTSAVNDLWNGTATKISELYGVSPSKEAIGKFISDSAQGVWSAGKLVVNDVWSGATSLVNDGWNGITSKISEVYGGVKFGIIDIYEGIKVILDDITGPLPNLFGFAATSFVFAASYAIAFSNPVTGALSIGTFMVVKGLAEYNGVRSSELKYQDSKIKTLSSHFNNQILNQFTEDKKSIYEEYKNEAFSFNNSHSNAMESKKQTLLNYLDEIEDYINNFSEKNKDFCASNEKSSHFTVLHYLRNIDNLKKDQDILSAEDKDSDKSGGQWYQKYFETKNSKQINDTFKTICEMRQKISEFKEKNDIEENDYKEFCVDNANEPLCSTFVKDVLFPELVDA